MVWIVWAFVCIVWSTVWLVIKVGVGVLPPVSFGYLRLAVALAVITPIAAAQGRLRVSRADALLLCRTGILLLTLNYAFLFWGAQFITSGLAAVLQSGTPGFGLLLAWWLGKEAITPSKVLGLALGAIGVTLIYARQATSSGAGALLGCTAVLLSGISVAAGYVIQKARGGHLHPTTVIAWQMWVGFVPLVAMGLWHDGSPLAFQWTRDGVLAIAYLALFGSIAAFWLNYWLLRRMDATALLVMGIVEAPLAAALGALFLRERMDAGTYAGSALVVSGVALVLRDAARAERIRRRLAE